MSDAADGRRFGEVADVYDEVRPGYPPRLTDAIRSYVEGPPRTVAEIGAGTGHGTAVLLGLGAPVTCVEPDPRMAAVLAARHPGVRVEVVPFERWSPPPGGVSLLACAMAWHWLDPATRNRRAFDALAPGGTLAVFGHRYAYADPDHDAAVGAAFRSLDDGGEQPPARPDGWARDDVTAAGLFGDVTFVQLTRSLPMSTAEYLRLVRTFGPFRARPPARQRAVLDALAATLDRLGGGTVLDLRTSLTLARRARAA
ncbi:class I SAM-dependent methyltransferase [Dactylosporangium aurantiacum]|uniref:Class I SAM-dependent methyltransferase n=1 Tax=Dactylosporangium aurantiacum TaxID=35754 RepID=A0A9Q9IAG7_9ACTN|nr:methyltransferase domain-containing protein [Dactylosporangium aurantiacum]MDG6108891.1 methyltransferase domain-containing protein [Dactylosporangium aurantiacum]UWZ52186.1 class I SAM-dependent methyltransferase [Dactylosporangium aurantiacum]